MPPHWVNQLLVIGTILWVKPKSGRVWVFFYRYAVSFPINYLRPDGGLEDRGQNPHVIKVLQP